MKKHLKYLKVDSFKDVKTILLTTLMIALMIWGVPILWRKIFPKKCKVTRGDIPNGWQSRTDVYGLYDAFFNQSLFGIGTNEAKVISIFSGKSNGQLAKIHNDYNKEFGRDLIKDLNSELSGIELTTALNYLSNLKC